MVTRKNSFQRQRWMAALAKASSSELEAWSRRLAPLPAYRQLRRPEPGLVMVQGRAGGNGAPFNLGEMTVTRCSVALEDGRIGHAYIAGRKERHAELAAVFDALLQGETNPALEEMVESLVATQAAWRTEQARQAGATKVDFFTLVRGEE